MSEKIGFLKWIADGIKTIPRKIIEATWNPIKWDRSSKEMFAALVVTCFIVALVYVDLYLENLLTVIAMIVFFIIAFVIMLHGTYLELTK